MSLAVPAANLLHEATRRLSPIAGDEGRLEAELLLSHALGVDRTRLLAMLPAGVTAEAQTQFAEALERRLAREPLSYVTGSCEFYGMTFECTPDALIPRPETEMLVDFLLDEIQTRRPASRVVDVGTGGGAIAVAVARNAPHVFLDAVDASVAALQLAASNAARHGVEGRIRFARTDLLAGNGEFDVIVANLPYVAEGDWAALAPEIRDHEPRAALVGGARGTEIIERLLDKAPAHLAAGAAMALEIGDGQSAELSSYARARFPGGELDVLKDLAGLDRMLLVRTAAPR